MKFIKSVYDYEENKKKIAFCVGPLKNELEIFQKLYDEFNRINVPILNTNDFQEYLKNGNFDCIATIEANKLIICDNDTGNKWTEEFEIDDYQFASDWCLGKIEYQDYLDYCKEKNNNYIISIWETDEDRALGEAFDYPQSYSNIDEAIKTAKGLIKFNNYSCVEVLDSKDKCFYWSDGKDEEYFNELNSIESDIQI